MIVLQPPLMPNRAFLSGRRISLTLLLTGLWIVSAPQAFAQEAPKGARVEGIVHDLAGKAIAGITVHLQEEGHSDLVEASTNSDGTFAFSTLNAGTYTVSLRKYGFRDMTDSIKLSAAETKHCDFVLQPAEPSSSASSAGAIQLDDRPNFTVAGVTDSAGSGGHGSETRIRTGEMLARETRGLAPARTVGAGPDTSASEGSLRAALLRNPHGYEANHRLGEFYFRAGRCRDAIPLLKIAYQASPDDHENAIDLAMALSSCGDFGPAREQVNRMLASEKDVPKPDGADLHRLLGDLDEKLDDPLGAEHEYERAAGLDSSEQNYFAWGAELLLHRAAAPAMEVFVRGVRLHPDSARMLAGLGAALYTSGSAEEGAQRLCQASDLDPASPMPYLFLGKMQEATPALLPCAEEKLAHFVKDQPENALANYYYALTLWKRDRGAQDPDTLPRAEALLQKATAIDPKLDSAYLQLGNLYFARAGFSSALAAYQKAVAATPTSSQAHYRLGLAYKRMGEVSKSQHEFEEYKELEKKEGDAIERQRRELRQFLIVLKDAPAAERSTP